MPMLNVFNNDPIKGAEYFRECALISLQWADLCRSGRVINEPTAQQIADESRARARVAASYGLLVLGRMEE